MQADLTAAVHGFLDALEQQVSHFTAAKKRAVSGLTGVNRAYELARLTRKQIAFTNELRLARTFKEIAVEEERSVVKLDEFISHMEKQLGDLNANPTEPSPEVTDQTGRTRPTCY